MNYQILLDEIKSTALEQGEILVRAFRDPDILKTKFEKSKKWKDDLDITTHLDIEIEKAFYDRLSKKFPFLGFNLEENTELNDSNKELVCYIDPIDGTKHFAKGIPLFAISVGIMKNNEPVLGLVYNPLADQLHTGAEGIPTTLNGHPAQVSDTNRLENAFIALDVSTHKTNWDKEKDWMNKKITEFNLKAKRIRLFSVGSIVTSWVSHGGLDAYVSIWGHASKPFDIAAGKALIKYSKGGMITDCNVEGLSEPRFVGGNEKLVNEICEILTSSL
jgi:myo-inositol-1(or 4)-monophosphatase